MESVAINVRVVAATNKNLKKLVGEGKFREDLYYRIRVVHLELPELKKRREDIPLLVEHIISKFNRIQGKNIEALSSETMKRLMAHDYPGNIRELENIIEQAFVLCNGGIIELHHLPPELRPDSTQANDGFGAMSLQSMGKHLIVETLRRFNGNRRKTAKELGIDASTLYRKMKMLQIDTPNIDGRHKK